MMHLIIFSIIFTIINIVITNSNRMQEHLQPVFTCSKSTVEAAEQCLQYVQS